MSSNDNASIGGASAGGAQRRRVVRSSMLGAGVALAAALLLIVNYFGWKYHTRFDWTGSQLYTLSEKTENVLAALDRDVEVVVFMGAGDELYDPVRELLARYESASPRISVRVLDPEKNLAEAQSLVEKYEISQLNVVVFDAGDDRRVIESADLADYDFSGLQFGGGATMEAFKGEQAFTGAIVELAESEKPSIVFTTGHGERQISDFSAAGLSEAEQLLGRDNFEIAEWAPLAAPEVPAGTDLVVVAGPTSRFAEPEVAALERYLEGGGRLLALVDPTVAEAGELSDSGLEPLLAAYGVELGRNIVVDPGNPLPFYGAETIFVDDYGDHVVTRALSQAQVPVIVPLARSVSRGETPEGFEAVELMRTTAEGWGETDLENLSRVEKGDDDLAGPVGLAIAVRATDGDGDGAENPTVDIAGDTAADAEGETAENADEVAAPTPPQETRLLVVGDSDFASNGQLLNVGNAELLANAMNWLAERETLVGIPPRAPEQVRLTLSQSQMRWLALLVLGLLPAAAIALGGGVYYRRRR